MAICFYNSQNPQASDAPEFILEFASPHQNQRMQTGWELGSLLTNIDESDIYRFFRNFFKNAFDDSKRFNLI